VKLNINGFRKFTIENFKKIKLQRWFFLVWLRKILSVKILMTCQKFGNGRVFRFEISYFDLIKSCCPHQHSMD